MAQSDQQLSAPPGQSADQASAARTFAALEHAVSGVVATAPSTVRLAVACLAAGGHLLVEDHPGLGKTTLAKALAGALGLGFHRLQCTADLLPADVVGATVLGPDGSEPVFRPGPVFTNILMADELNRASPRAQSALLEAMEERQVSVDGTTHALPGPLLRAGHPEPLRRHRHLPTPPRAARPVPRATHPGLPRAARRWTPCWRARTRPRRSDTSPLPPHRQPSGC